jgi:uncharacterized protein DUF3592
MGAMVVSNPFRWADPHTWPWFLYVELAAIAGGFALPLWRWIQRNRAKGWPIATGQIESVSVNESKQFLTSWKPRQSSTTYVAELGYSYSVAENVEAGFYKREFGTEEEAWEFLRDLKGKPVPVHYNPNKPSTSTLLEPDIQTLLQTRAPRPAGDVFASLLADSVPEWLKPFLWTFIGLSAVGLVVSLWVHVGAVMGRRVAPEAFFWILHMGIFVVWFPATFVAQRRVGNVRRKDFWKVVLKGSPEWMRYLVYGFLGYAIVNFSLFLYQEPNGGSGTDQPAIVWRGFSGHWMAFYSAAFAILYSAARESRKAPRCLNGHPVVPNANFCQRCGQPVMHT